MKRIKIYVAIAVLFIMSISSLQSKAQSGVSVNFQFFYDNLSPYGTWVSYPHYGYVWRPKVGRGFHPYRTSGHWVWSDEYQWIWVSDYSWGWGPFHYGRWHYDRYYGWLWVPDYDWAPAWVVWRSGGDYYGWAPLDAGISISISFGNYNPSADYWCFAPRRYITSPTIYNYYIPVQRNVTIINNTTVINNYNRNGGPTRNVFVNGPQRTEAEKYTHQSIRPVKLSETSRPGRTTVNNNQITVYRPKVNAADKNSAKPSKVVPVEKLNKINEPARNQPVNNQSVKKEPVRNQPVNNQPVKKEPVRNQPVNNQPVKKEPVRNQPVNNQPVRKEPVRNQPVNNQPVKKEPVRNQPVNNQPARKEPGRNQPVKNEPQGNQQGKNQPPKKKNG